MLASTSLDIGIKPADGLRPRKLRAEDAIEDFKGSPQPNAHFKLLIQRELAKIENTVYWMRGIPLSHFLHFHADFSPNFGQIISTLLEILDPPLIREANHHHASFSGFFFKIRIYKFRYCVKYHFVQGPAPSPSPILHSHLCTGLQAQLCRTANNSCIFPPLNRIQTEIVCYENFIDPELIQMAHSEYRAH